MEGAQPEPGLEEENGQPEEQASQKRSGEGWVFLGHHLLYIMHLCVLTLSHKLFCFPPASPLSHQAALPTGSWSVTTKHLRGPERPKPRRAGSLREGEKSKRSEWRSSNRVTSCLYNFKIICLPHLKKNKTEKHTHTKKTKRTKKPYVTVPVRWELPSDKVQCCRLPEKFINNCSADGTSARRAAGWML